MYHNHQHFEQQQNQQLLEEAEADLSEPPPSYAKILQWSVDKLARAGGCRRKPSDLRRNLLIAGAMGKARAAMLRQRALSFLEARPQMMPPSGYHQHHHQQHQQQQQPEPEPQPEEEESCTSAFGLFPAAAAPPPQSTPSEEATTSSSPAEDALSASAEAIVMSSVELSICGLEEDDDLPPTTPLPTPTLTSPTLPQTRKRKQPVKKPPPLELESATEEQQQPQQHQETAAVTTTEDSATSSRPLHSPAKRTRQPAATATAAAAASAEEPDAGSLRVLQASFVDLSMSGGGSGCRQQAMSHHGHGGQQFFGQLNPCWGGFFLASGPPECHSFA